MIQTSKKKQTRNLNSKCIKLSSKDHSVRIKNKLENMVTYQTRQLQETKLWIIRLVRRERCAAQQKKIFNLICIITSRTKREITLKGLTFSACHINREKTPSWTRWSPLVSDGFFNTTVYEEEEEGRKRQSTFSASVFSPLSAALCRSTSSAFPTFTSSTLKGALTEWLSAASINTLKLVSSIAVLHCGSTNVSP